MEKRTPSEKLFLNHDSPRRLIQIPSSGDYSLSVLLLDEASTTGGNKYYKLKYNLLQAEKDGKQHVVTMGGPFSNHIAATAQACKKYGFRCTGIIRGESDKNITLRRAVNDGMHLKFVSRSDYRKYREPGNMEMDFPDAYCLPEGGSNALAVKGCSEILDGITDFDIVLTATGSGSTLAGIASSINPLQEAIGISVLKNAHYLEQQIAEWLKNTKTVSKWRLLHGQHCGGYAKTNPELLNFISEFNQNHSFRIEPVYTGKVFLSLTHPEINKLLSGKRVIVLHTGGLQYLL